MTAEELITELQKYPSTAKIVVAGYENGYNDISEVKNVSIAVHVDSAWWDGFYDDSKTEPIEAVALLGTNDK